MFKLLQGRARGRRGYFDYEGRLGLGGREWSKRSRGLSGFTIIEVVLVLAIAGLIFLMIFVALPALQSAQRDTLRRQDVGVIVAAVQKFMANNHGRVPAATEYDEASIDEDDPRNEVLPEGSRWVGRQHSRQLDKYLAGLSEDWVTTSVGVVNGGELQYQSRGYITFILGERDIAGHVDVITHAVCPEEDSLTASGGEYMRVTVTNTPKDIAIFRYLESGKFYCENVY